MRFLKIIIITLFMVFLTVSANAEMCVIEKSRKTGVFIQRICIDGYEYVFVRDNSFGSIDIQQSFRTPSHAYGGANPKRCKCPQPIIPKKHFWEK